MVGDHLAGQHVLRAPERPRERRQGQVAGPVRQHGEMVCTHAGSASADGLDTFDDAVEPKVIERSGRWDVVMHDAGHT